MDLKSKIRTIPDWPKPGVMFKDITTLIKDPQALNFIINQFFEKYKDKKIDKIVGIESRGFIFGSILAHRLGCGFVPARKPGKLPAKATKIEYQTEYSTDALEIHNDAILPQENVLIVDDLLATGGTMKAAIQLIEKLGGKVEGCACLIELAFLKGIEKIKGYDFFSLVQYKSEEE